MFKKFWLKPGLSDLKMWMYILQDEQNNPSTFQLWETFLDFSSYKYKEVTLNVTKENNLDDMMGKKWLVLSLVSSVVKNM